MNKLTLTLAALAGFHSTVLAAPVSITAASLVYTQNFNSLGTATVAWTNDSTIPGWYVQINNGTTATGNAQATDGIAVLSGLLNLGASASADRALGSKATGTGNLANIAYAVSFQNNGTNPVAFTQLQYTGELWRTNTGTGTPTPLPVDEEYTVFYQVSGTAVTNVLSGTSSATAAPGAGFTALGAGANWVNPVNSPLGTALDGNAPANRSPVTFSPSGVTLLPGQFLMLKWTDANEAGTDGFQGIDDVTITFTELSGSVSIAASARTRSYNGTPLDNSDDTFGFTANITGSGSISANWITTDVNPHAGNTSSGPYGTPVVWTGFPIAPKTVTVSDSANAALNASVTVDPLLIIGSNNLVTTGTPILQDDAPVAGWAVDDTARTLTLTAQAVQSDKIVNSQVVDLSAAGFVQFVAELDAITGASSGFETADHFALQLIIDDGTPVSVLGAADTNSDGLLSGAAANGTPGVWVELPDPDDVSDTASFSFSYIIPDTANSVQIRIIGSSNSVSETFVVKTIALNPPPPTLSATLAGPSAFNNMGTVNPADDNFSGFVNIFGVNLGLSPGWHSDEVPPRAGSYSRPNPVTFGPYPITGGAKTVTLTDDLAVPAVSATVVITLPSAATLTAAAPTNILRIENGPGPADDVVTFDTAITGANGGPGWTATGATPGAGAFGPVTFTIPAPLPASPATITVADASYPAVSAVLTVPIPARYVIGQKNLGAGTSDVLSDFATEPSPQWVNDAALRTLTMSAGLAADSVVTSEVINLSGTGLVYFTALLNAAEASVGSNFETIDRFKAELIIDGGTATEQIINLVSSYDTGDGAPAVGAAGGPNGPPNGYINGYQGIAIAPATAEDDYNNNRDRDEFNARGEIADVQINNNFPLSYTIPATANTVQLKIYGAGAASTETFLVSNVLFSAVAPTADTDGDGITDLAEIMDGTDPHNATSLFTITTLTSGPGGAQVVGFPTVAGRVYRGYFSTDLATWTRDDSVPLVTGNGTVQYWTLPVLPVPEARHYLKVLVGFSASDFPATLP